MTDAEHTPETTTTPEVVTTQPETFDREYVEKLRAENAKHRTRAKEAEEAAQAAKTAAERDKMDEVERLKAEKADADKRAQEVEARAVTAERKASITGKVADADAALKLLDPEKHLAEDGTVNVEALLESYPFMAPTKSGITPTTGAGGSVGNTGALKPEDFRGKSQEWITANLHRLTK